MSTGAGNLSRHRFFAEFTVPQVDERGGVLISPAAQKARAVANLGFTATIAQINAVGTGTVAPVATGDVTSYAVLAADSGKTFIIPDLTANCTFTLPAAAAGLNFHFIGKASAADAQNWIFTSPAPFLKGGVTWSAAAANAGVFGNGSSHLTLTVVTPSGGTFVDFYYDGTNWIVNGQIMSATTPAFS